MSRRKVQQKNNLNLELGRFEDLKTLVALLNSAFTDVAYRLDNVPEDNSMYLFVEDVLDEDEYACGIVVKRGDSVYAISSDVQEMILNAYMRFKRERGIPM